MLVYLTALLDVLVYYGLYRGTWRLVRRCQVGPLRPRRPPQAAAAVGAASGVSRLFQLPSELVLAITDELDPASQIFLSRTCHALRTQMATTTAKALQDLAQRPMLERLDFLAKAALSEPDAWCCELCVALHPAAAYDVRGSGSGTCEIITGGLVYPWRHPGTCPYRLGRLMAKPSGIKHRHVQLALKYDRMQREQEQARTARLRGRPAAAPYRDFGRYHRRYLRRLMDVSYKNVHIGAFLAGWNAERSTPCFFQPKIVTGGDGRRHFLLLSVYPACPQDKLDRDNFSHSSVRWCPHTDMGFANKRTAPLDPQYDCAVVHFWPWYNRRAAPVPTQDGTTIETTEIRTACHRCSTDLVMRVDGYYIYQDFGAEDAPSSPSWRAHLEHWYAPRASRQVNYPWYVATESHVPGSIETMYEREPDGDTDAVAEQQ